MDENLVGYLLNALEPEEQRELEKHLKDDPAAQQKLETLRRALEPLAADKEPPDPPSGLVFHTLARVAEYRCRPEPEVTPAPPTVDVHAGRPWYRRADLLIAASLLIVIGGIGVPGLVKLRSEHQKTSCENTMRVLYQGLDTYYNKEGEFPCVGNQPEPYNRAGMFVPILRDAGALASNVNLRCPANGQPHATTYTLAGLKGMKPEEFEEAAPHLSGCYAYSLGYYDPDPMNPRYWVPRRGETDLNDSRLPILADRPAVRGNDRGNSPNHNGQNVLYVDGHVEYHHTPVIDGDHIYLNRHGKVGAGINLLDTVLGCSEDKP